ncbi:MULTISPECIES: hypothetical protein [Haloferax]|uniref:CopG family transcriptional regulator n=2 Tax=Haloferax TaxID=2251 RepID=A0A6G1Z155_9EURY|nr:MULTISPECIES: hypothetical protein [Haloferax]KAB1187469.1 hypothetical protein Hfx1149_05265 [Haloferax sp. CBA1149]MRW80121.1 hypothetical protein [Haloferax marinisediminis]
MSNEPSDRSDREIATTTFEDWLDQKAAETNSSREYVLEQLLDSYWTLKEVTQVVNGRDSAAVGADIDESDDAHRETSPHAGAAVTEDEFGELVERVESLHKTLQTESERRSTLTEDVQSLAERLDEFEGEHASVDEVSDTVEDVRTSLEAEQERLQARLDEEFDNLRTILEYLVETGDSLDVRLTETQIQYRAELREIRAERAQLRRIRQDARDAGTYTADCERCGETIDFALLTEPNCPNCGRTLTGVESETKWLFLSRYTATTGTPSPANAPDSTSDSTEQREREDETSETGDETDATADDVSAADDENDTGETEDETTTDDGKTVTQTAQASTASSPNKGEFEWQS